MLGPAECVLSDLEFSDCLQQTLTARAKTLELTESVRTSSTHQVANRQNTAQQHFFFVVLYVVPSNFSDLLLLIDKLLERTYALQSSTVDLTKMNYPNLP